MPLAPQAHTNMHACIPPPTSPSHTLKINPKKRKLAPDDDDDDVVTERHTYAYRLHTYTHQNVLKIMFLKQVYSAKVLRRDHFYLHLKSLHFD